MTKRQLLSQLIGNMDAALAAGQYFEASWYASALLEDRLSSILRSTGGEGPGGVGAPKKMLGSKVEELDKRAGWGPHQKPLLDRSALIVAAFCWKEDRNKLMHSMADGSMSIAEINVAKEKLARDGVKIVKDTASLALQLKKHRHQVPSIAGAASSIVPRPNRPKAKK